MLSNLTRCTVLSQITSLIMELAEFQAQLARYPVRWPADSVQLPAAASPVQAAAAPTVKHHTPSTTTNTPSTAEYIAKGGDSDKFGDKLQAWLATTHDDESAKSRAQRAQQVWYLASLSLNREDLVRVARGVHSGTPPGT